MNGALWLWWQQGDAVARGTAVLLLALSVASWVVIVWKLWFMASGRRQATRAMAAFWQARDLAEGCARAGAIDRRQLVAPMADAVGQALSSPAEAAALAGRAARSVRLTRGLRQALQVASQQLQWGQTLLATVGATAPFVGLLGTVWGIHHALATLAGSGQIGIEQLAGPVGEALVMTAAGLAVALPAVLAYNLMGRAAAQLEALLEGFAHDLQAMFGTEPERDVDDGMALPPAGPMEAP
ncbi:MAG: MotA/TolQ/ExbB proton channel family protein [Burkholderiaceae bacterium]|jgi:biopolymer transport protein ExbB|nr:MotA/TolQ/ExbB proton channel family protein [Burkholderiaceae bacterium]